MRFKTLILFMLAVAATPSAIKAQNWAGILKPTSGSGACTLAPSLQAAGCAIDWSQTGIPGGVPSDSWTQSGSTISAATYGNGSSDATNGIQTALNGCSGNKFVLLGPGTFRINSSVNIGSNCELRGSGADQTILSTHGSSQAPVTLGSSSVTTPGGSPVNKININSGASAGSTSLTLSSVSGMSTGQYLVIGETDNAAFVSIHGGEGDCTWCDAGWSSAGNLSRGQIVEIQNISGSVVTISPGLYSAYTQSPFVVFMTASAKHAGLRDLQLYANNTGYNSSIFLDQCAYCWVQGVEANYSDGDFLEDSWGFRNQIQSNYFSNNYLHSAGGSDSDIDLDRKTTATQVVNNIIERGHDSIMMEWGAAGNVVAYNYMEGEFDAGNSSFVIGGIVMHGAHPQFNLIEGNVGDIYDPDEIWGSSSHNTNFRNWFQGTTTICGPPSGRGTVNCSPSSNTSFFPYGTNHPFQQSYAENIAHLSRYDNIVGDVAGSAAQMALLTYGTGTTSHVAILPWGSGTRSYDSTNYNFTFGFGEGSDDGSGNGCGNSTPCHSTDAYKTALIYNAYTFANSTTNCLSGGSASTCGTSLPASFYLAGKPTWWTSGVTFPAIGPDVTGGSGPGGHASLTSSNPAQHCYLSTMGGVEGGAGGPLSFNAAKCYGGTVSNPVGSGPAAPTGLTAVVQ